MVYTPWLECSRFPCARRKCHHGGTLCLKLSFTVHRLSFYGGLGFTLYGVRTLSFYGGFLRCADSVFAVTINLVLGEGHGCRENRGAPVSACTGGAVRSTDLVLERWRERESVPTCAVGRVAVIQEPGGVLQARLLPRASWKRELGAVRPKRESNVLPSCADIAAWRRPRAFSSALLFLCVQCWHALWAALHV